MRFLLCGKSHLTSPRCGTYVRITEQTRATDASTHLDESRSLLSSPRYAGGSLPTLPRDLGNRLLDIVKLDDYQEPYQALKYAPYYSYSTVVMEMKDMMLNNKATGINHSGTYIYMYIHGARMRPRSYSRTHVSIHTRTHAASSCQ